MSEPPVGILLAAGQSQRFGSHKLLHPLNNKPMLLVSAEKLARVLPNSVVVIHPQLESLVPQLQQLSLRVVINDHAADGMGSSIACGVDASQDASGWLIVLADMPFIKAETISLLADKLQNHGGMVAPVYEQQRGHPVGFHQQYKDELMALSGDVGARRVIEKHQRELELLPIDDAGVITDIDHAEDLEA
jgi:molybdenum cofactor cytidylyltransferase